MTGSGLKTVQSSMSGHVRRWYGFIVPAAPPKHPLTVATLAQILPVPRQSRPDGLT